MLNCHDNFYDVILVMYKKWTELKPKDIDDKYLTFMMILYRLSQFSKDETTLALFIPIVNSSYNLLFIWQHLALMPV